jgi:hypothetical protein
MTEENLGSKPDRHSGKRRAVVVALGVTMAVVAVPLLLSLGDDSPGGAGEDDAVVAVRAAVGKTMASGSYETDFETHSTSPAGPSAQPCPRGAPCPLPSGNSTFETRGHGVVNFDPYISRNVTETSVGPRTLYVTSTTVWLFGGGGTGAIAPGIPLSEFAATVQSSLGPSQGALAMIALASPGGSLNLEEEAVADATPAGDGTVDGASVTYYDVTIDMTKLADTPELADVQRETIQAVLPLLDQGGYTGTTERIGVDEAGLIREVTATTHFADGSTGTRHTVLSNFGCAPRISPPDQPAPATTTPATCPVPVTTTTTAPTTSTSTTVAPSTTTSVPAPSTTAPGEASDVEAIGSVFLRWMNAENRDDISAYVEDADSILEAHRQGLAQHTPEDLAKYSGRVDSIEVIDAAHADVRYTILWDGTPQYAFQPGQAVKIDGTWMVSRDTVCALLAHGGITCPPRTTNTPAR